MASGSIAGLIPTVTGGKTKAKHPPSSYIRLYTIRADATYPDLLVGSSTESELDALAELTGTRSPSEMKKVLITLRNLIKQGAVQIVAVEPKTPAKK